MVEVGDGEIGTFADLPAMIDGTLATYRAVEMTDVAGYTSVIVDGDGNKLSTETDFANSQIAMEATNRKNPPGDFGISFTKKALGGTELEGATMVLKDVNGNVITSWTSGKEAYELELPAGEYILVETAAPEGYKCITTEMIFVVDEYGVVTLKTAEVNNGGKITVLEGNNIVLEDAPEIPETPDTPKDQKKPEAPTPEKKPETPTSEKKPDTPQTVTPSTPSTTRRAGVPSTTSVSKATSTGDSNNTVLWIVLAAAAAAAIAGIGFAMTRRRRKDI